MSKKRILVVDDYPQVVDMIKMRLEFAGFDVEVAYDGQEGLLKARKIKPDLIILDVMLPKMNGYKVCRILKFDKKYQHIPIIILTSRARKSDVEIGKQTGANEYLFKPYNPKKLIAIVKKHVDNNNNPEMSTSLK